MSSALQMLSCCCGATPCTNGTGCTGSYVLTNCAGMQFVLPTVADVSVSASYARSYFDDNPYGTIPPSYITHSPADGNGIVVWYLNTSWDVYDDLSFSVSATAPTTSAYATPGAGLTGYYRKYVIGALSYEFDGTGGTGVTISASTTRRTLADVDTQTSAVYGGLTAMIADTNGGSGRDADSFTINSSTSSVVPFYQKLEYSFDINYTLSPTDATYNISNLRLQLNTIEDVERTTSITTVEGGRFNPGPLYTSHTITHDAVYVSKVGVETQFNIDSGVSDTPAVDPIGGSAGSGACDGTEKTFDTAYEFRVEGSGWDDGIRYPFGDSGSASIQLASSFVEADIGCRDCDRVLDLAGTLTHQTYEDGTFDPMMGEFPELGNGLSIGTMDLSARLVLDPVAICDSYQCLYTMGGSWPATFATLTPPSVAPIDVTLLLTRVGPYLWRIDVTGWEIGPLYVKFSGECPTGTATVCQTLNPNTITGSAGNDLSSYYHYSGYGGDPPGSGQPASEGWDYNDHTVTIAEVDNSSATFDPNYDNWITEHTLTISTGTPEVGDPTYLCDEDCASAADDYASFIRCGTGDPPDGEVYVELNRTSGCHWEGTGATYSSTLDWADGTWTQVVTRISDSVVVFTATWLGASTSPIGSHGYDGSIWDEAACTVDPGGLRSDIT